MNKLGMMAILLTTWLILACGTFACIIIDFNTVAEEGEADIEERNADAMAKEAAIFIKLNKRIIVLEQKMESYEILEGLGE